jgi:predicted RNA-binding Zn-ribbon protein involved in translation (DUF1610 family)
MDIATITAAYEALKASKQLLTSMFEAKVDAEAKPKILAALEQLGAAQDTLYAMRDELFKVQAKNEELRRELEAIEVWKAVASQYQMDQTAGGAVVYKFTAAPVHYACPSCFNKKELQPLQDNRTISGKFRCAGCSAEYPINPRQKVAVVAPARIW